MQSKIAGGTFPSVPAVQAEAARIESMIAAATRRIESSACDLRTFMHLQVRRAELEAYFAGLLYSLGYTDLLDAGHVGPEFALSQTQLASVADSFVPVGQDEDPRYVQCFEC